MPLTVTPPNANSYVTLAEAITIAGLLDSLSGYGINAAPFLAAPDAVKELALTQAAVGLNTFGFVGEPETPGQTLAWPRSGTEYGPGVIPEAVKHAQVADACRLVAPRSMAETAYAEGFQSIGLQDKSAVLRVDPSTRRPAAVILASARLLTSGEIGFVPVYRS